MFENRFIKLFNNYVESAKIFPVYRARVALYLFLKSLNLKPHDEVIITGLTCVVVPNAVIYAGLKPIYIDIDPNTYCMDPLHIKKNINKKTKVLVIQNSFGYTDQYEQLLEIAKEYNLYTIHDCAHGFGNLCSSNKSLKADATFYSSQWNKPFSTGVGGYLLVHNKSLVQSCQNEYTLYQKPTLFENISLFFLIICRKLLMTSWTYWFFRSLYRYLSSKNKVIGSSTMDELINTSMPHNYLKKMGWTQYFFGIQALNQFDKVCALRRKNTRIYEKYLKSLGLNITKAYKNHVCLTYPLRVKKRSVFMKKAEKASIPLGDWFVSPIHPVTLELEKWNLDVSKIPYALKASEELINLPTGTKDIERVITFLKENHSFLIMN